MGVAISGWNLASAVARRGHLGVVSGTALEVVWTRRLQHGDPGGHARRALDHFPVPDMANRVIDAYYVEGGKAPTAPYKNVRSPTIDPDRSLLELIVVCNFIEVFLAKEGHGGPVGINYMRKIELPLLAAAYGALLAGVDFVLVGAGNPHELPEILNRLAEHLPVSLALRVQGATSADGDTSARLEPAALMQAELPPLNRPRFLAIVASHDLAAGLAASDSTRPDGFVVEGPPAGGHNAPPRGPRRVDERGQPIYDERDEVDPAVLAGLGLPFWYAGGFGTPDGLRRALADGATGVQVGTPFALCRESGLQVELKRALLDEVAAGTVSVRSDWRASPTGFPFKVVELDGSLSDQQVYENRRRVCDLGALRVPYKTPDGTIAYRCPAEPERAYIGIKGGRAANMEGRLCLCNALISAAGLPQVRSSGYVEPPVVTGGSDYQAVAELLRRKPPGQEFYTADDVIDYLT